MRFEILQVQEHRRVAVPGQPEQRQRNQVSDTPDWKQILRREQPVVTGQVHLPRIAIASPRRPGPRRPAVSAGTGAAKKLHACIPTPEGDPSSVTGTPNARPAL